jgi:hypothetical protein
MAGKLMLNPWVYDRSGMKPPRFRATRRPRNWPLYRVGDRIFNTIRAARTEKKIHGGRIEKMTGMMGPHREVNPEFWENLTSREESDLYDLWQLSKVPTSQSYPTEGARRYARRGWAAGEMAKRHPRMSATGFYKIYERRGMNPRRRRRNWGRVPGMLRAPKWRLYGRKRRYNASRGEMLRAGTHRARRHALSAMRSGDLRTAQRYLGLEERLMARRRVLGLNRGRKRRGRRARRRAAN